VARACARARTRVRALSLLLTCSLSRTVVSTPALEEEGEEARGLNMAVNMWFTQVYRMLQCVAVCCSVMQCAAVCCSVLQCVAEC
jgi:hypothetical protein